MTVQVIKYKLAENIRQWMHDNDMTQTEAALFIETTQPRVSMIVNNKLESIKIDSLVTYNTLLGFTVSVSID